MFVFSITWKKTQREFAPLFAKGWANSPGGDRQHIKFFRYYFPCRAAVAKAKKYDCHNSGMGPYSLSPKKESTNTSRARAISRRRSRFFASEREKSNSSKARHAASFARSSRFFPRHENARPTSLPILAICETSGSTSHPPFAKPAWKISLIRPDQFVGRIFETIWSSSSSE